LTALLETKWNIFSDYAFQDNVLLDALVMRRIAFLWSPRGSWLDSLSRWLDDADSHILVLCKESVWSQIIGCRIHHISLPVFWIAMKIVHPLTKSNSELGYHLLKKRSTLRVVVLFETLIASDSLFSECMLQEKVVTKTISENPAFGMSCPAFCRIQSRMCCSRSWLTAGFPHCPSTSSPCHNAVWTGNRG
jgi:hypothetical protein